jgi:2-dehydro-3-deoxyglucarate aldolase/4-hydroxy-2-oxoheptanedioate aldolase
VLASTLKQRLHDRQYTIGPFLSSVYWAGYLEIFQQTGMHYAVLDLEHGPCSLRDAEELCRTARLLGFPLLIRPEGCVFHLLRKYLDMGPAGFLIPWTETPEQIATLRDALFTPTRGRRGPGGPSIEHNRSLDRAGWDDVEDNLFVAIQIESPAGIERLTDLAGEPWIDAVMLGPYDLSLNLGLAGQLGHPDLVRAIDGVRDGAAAVGKPCGMVMGRPQQARFWRDRGFPLALIPDPAYLVRQHLLGFIGGIEAAGESAAP